MKLVCEICFSFIAQVSENVGIPVKGDMFTSMAPHRQIPAPFHASLGWEEFRCPKCLKRPMIQPDRIMTDHPRCFESMQKGPIYQQLQEVPMEFEEEREGFKCPKCGKNYKSYGSYRQHHKCPELKQKDSENG